MANLVIVESPFKAPTIKGYLGSGYKVLASKGHVRDLPKSQLGVDIENNFTPKYINIRGKGDLIKQLKKEAKNADKVFLATDPDREGEAIAWHLANALGLDVTKANRVTFNEITKTAVKAGFKNPRTINMDLVDAQQARRVLDRIVGYKISPLFWKRIHGGLSAGRVQSVTTRLIVDREKEIENFVPQEYWSFDAQLLAASSKKAFTAKFFGDAATGKKIALPDEETTAKIYEEVRDSSFVVKTVAKKLRLRNPAPPFITSTLQQEASRKLGFQSTRTMRTAQELYEGLNVDGKGETGLITYMRTDSLRVSDEASETCRNYIAENYGEKYVPAQKRIYKSKSNVQDAHEAIRPSNMALQPEKIKKSLTSDQYRLYKLIWDRFIASQMASAELDTVNADITAGAYLFRASGFTVRFKGFLEVYEEGRDDADDEKTPALPEISEGEVLKVKSLEKDQHFTQPAPRYNEATLIKTLEEKGIARPSTYTPTISTIIERGYVEREGKSLKPTNLGFITNDIMTEEFSDIVDYEFTANLEAQLDKIEDGEENWVDVLSRFYSGFSVMLEKAEKEIENEKIAVPEEESDVICELCGRRMVVKKGRFGKFLACPGYPECKNTKPLNEKNAEPEEPTGIKCELCGRDMVIKRGRYGKFYACSGYPECKNAKPIQKPTEALCPKCGGQVLVKRMKTGKTYFGCENAPKCDFMTWDTPTAEKCPKCGASLFMRSRGKKLVCLKEGCGYERDAT